MTTLADMLPASRAMGAAGGYARLAKPRIAALSTLAAAAGFLLASPQLPERLAPTLAGLFLLACGCGALNQRQERDPDARMPRTRCRPLPAGEIRTRGALLFSVGLLLAGLALLHLGGGPAAALLGLAAALWYNGVYTPLKRKSPLAFLPGAIVGAVPPAIGWVSAGGDLRDPRIVALCGLLLIWQIPHVVLLQLAHAAEYAAAGFPVLPDLLPARRLARLVFVGVLGTAAAGLLLPLPAPSTPLRVALALASAALAANGATLLWGGGGAVRGVFRAVNGYLLIVLALAVVAGVR
jgi:protoheme IX farnesyltransferase